MHTTSDRRPFLTSLAEAGAAALSPAPAIDIVCSCENPPRPLACS